MSVFKELTPSFRTYELRGQGEKKSSIRINDKQTPHTEGKKKALSESKTNKHLTLSMSFAAKGGKKGSIRIKDKQTPHTEGKKVLSESKTNKHLTLSYKNYLQKPHLPP